MVDDDWKVVKSSVQLLPQTPDERSSFPDVMIVHAGKEVRVSRTHCIDKQGPDESGHYLFYYEYDLYDFTSDRESVRAKSYSDEPDEVSFLGMQREHEHTFLTKRFIASSPLIAAACLYLTSSSKCRFRWLDPDNTEVGYSEMSPCEVHPDAPK
ncbi:hypothetical protein [uncultured Nevskia sp.]|uniref:hypothetical protein n=1 Tax=uncultured Nevskia sp. TaxID=228950 RepID=UPI0025CD2DFC|nr:hypothetical protein [uncultured Nevskia sp.]